MLKRDFTKLHFLWRENHIDYLWASNVTAKSYFLKEGILVYDKEVLTAYATKREMEAVKTVAKSIMTDQRMLINFERNLDKIRKLFIQSKRTFTRNVLKKHSSENLYKEYVRLMKLIKRYIHTYRLADPHYSKHLDFVALRYIKEREDDLGNPEKFFSKLARFDESKLLKYGFKAEELHIFHKIDKIARLRFEGKKIESYIEKYAKSILFETARRVPYSEEQISSMSLAELRRVLVQNKKIDENKLSELQDKFALEIRLTKNGNKITLLSKKEVEELIEFKRGNRHARKIKGSIAYPGFVSGFVRLAPPLSDQEKYAEFIMSLGKDDILVASMTTPGLTPAFNRICAVVTDEGGLTSHAALIAREKRVPCIMGTKIASQILDEGEFITVDAENGFVVRMRN